MLAFRDWLRADPANHARKRGPSASWPGSGGSTCRLTPTPRPQSSRRPRASRQADQHPRTVRVDSLRCAPWRRPTPPGGGGRQAGCAPPVLLLASRRRCAQRPRAHQRGGTRPARLAGARTVARTGLVLSAHRCACEGAGRRSLATSVPRAGEPGSFQPAWRQAQASEHPCARGEPTAAPPAHRSRRFRRNVRPAARAPS
jgi:hypothetical protein